MAATYDLDSGTTSPDGTTLRTLARDEAARDVDFGYAGTGRVAGFTFLTPLFGILAGAALLGEHVSPALLVGLVAIAVGMRLVNSRSG